MVITRYKPELQTLNLTEIDQVKAFRGVVVKTQSRKRDIVRIEITRNADEPLVLFLKRYWKSYKKDGLYSIAKFGEVRSMARCEWENSRLLNAAGIKTAELVAYGEECGLFQEYFSFLITQSAPGTQTLDEFMRDCRDYILRNEVIESLAELFARLHNAGLAAPDIYSWHIFVDLEKGRPEFCLIDMARVDHYRDSCGDRLRTRDLASLNASLPRSILSAKERIRFLTHYSPKQWETLLPMIKKRMDHLPKRSKFRNF